MTSVRASTLVIWVLLFAPVAAFAQSSVTGVVKDSSGGVLPGVTVEAASPALIEKTREAVTDQAGQYKIIDLRPGTYSGAFRLEGFAVITRAGVELPATFTATINAELNVGALQKSATVSGESPSVDVQNVTQQSVMNR